ncbi:MAG: flagellar hook-length control protein FliK [Halanaerobium sp.]
MNREMFVGNLNSALKRENSVKNNSSPEKKESRFADLLERSKMRVQEDRALKQKISEKLSKNSKKLSKESAGAGHKKELAALQKKLSEELELDDSQTAELASFMLENELELEKMLDLLKGIGNPEELLELSSESRAELAELLLNLQNTAEDDELGFKPDLAPENSLEFSAESAADAADDLSLDDLLNNSGELDLNDIKEVFASGAGENGELDSEALEFQLKQLLADLSEQNRAETEAGPTQENKEKLLILKLLQKLSSAEQKGEASPAEVVKEFSEGELPANFREDFAEIIKKYLDSAETEASAEKRQDAVKADALAAEMLSQKENSSQQNSELSSAVKALLQAEMPQDEGEVFNNNNSKEQAAYFNPDPESGALFNFVRSEAPSVSSQSNEVANSQASLNIEDQILETFKAEYSAESKELTVELEPASLGKIDISLSYEGDKLVGKMLVESEAVRSSLEKNLNTLKNDLLKEGINIEQFKIQTSENRPTQVKQQDQFAFNQDQGRFSNADHDQNQNNQQRNAFRQRYFNQKISADGYQSIEASAISSDFNYGWNQSALNLLA